MIPLEVIERATLGPYTQLILHWPDDLPAPHAGQSLRLGDGSLLWPMRPPLEGRLSVLGTHRQNHDPLVLQGIEGHEISLPAGDTLILAEGLGLAPLIHLCHQLRSPGARANPKSGHDKPRQLLALYEADTPLPFRPRPSRFMVEGMPPGVIAAIPLLEDWGIPSRLSSPSGLPGCFEGPLDELLAQLETGQQTFVIALGREGFLERIGRIIPVAVALNPHA